MAKVPHIHRLQRPGHPPHHLLMRNAQILWPKGDILFDNGGDNLVIGRLKDHADCRADGPERVDILSVPFLDPYFPLCRQ